MPDTPPELLIKHRRRAPRYRTFIGTGVVVGLVAAVIVTLLSGSDNTYSTQSVLGYTSAGLALTGGMLGGLIAVILDRRS